MADHSENTKGSKSPKSKPANAGENTAHTPANVAAKPRRIGVPVESLLVSAVAVAFAIFYTLNKMQPQLDLPKVMGTVEVHPFPNDFVASEFVKHRQPAVLVGSGVSEWSCANWTTKLLHKHQGKTKIRIRESEHAVFTLAASSSSSSAKPLLYYKNIDKPKHVIREGSFKEFENTTAFIHFSDSVQNLPKSLQRLLPADFSKFHVATQKFGRSLGLSELSSMETIWVASQGTVAQTHYDKSHNFVVQLQGCKRWLLTPPDFHDTMYLFSELDARYKQSRVDPTAPQTNVLKSFPLFADSEAITVDLCPGQVLYVPPYWMHRVQALNTSISLSIISPSEEEMIYAHMLTRTISALSSENPDQANSLVAALSALKTFFSYLFAKIDGRGGQEEGGWLEESGEEFVKRVLAESRLLGVPPFRSKSPVIEQCMGEILSPHTKQGDKINRAALTVAEDFGDLPPTVRELILANLLEDVANELAANDPHRVLLKCIGKISA